MGNSRNENLLENILGEQNEILEPMSNNEKILLNILGETGVEIDPPQSRIENRSCKFLNKAAAVLKLFRCPSQKTEHIRLTRAKRTLL